MRHLLLIFTLFSLINCAGKVGEDKSDDLKNDNTNLKVRNTQLDLSLKQANERADSLQRALDGCYKAKQ